MAIHIKKMTNTHTITHHHTLLSRLQSERPTGVSECVYIVRASKSLSIILPFC